MKEMSIFIAAALFFSFRAHAAAPELLSVYTSLNDEACVIYTAASLEKDPEIDYLTQECVGLGGYQVMISGGDLRYPLSLVYAGKEIELTRFYSFHDVGSDKVEWLYTRSTDGKVAYKALIHRIVKSFEGENSAVLIVTKLAQENSCTVGVVKQAADMNEQARALAEKIDDLKCMNLDDMSK